MEAVEAGGDLSSGSAGRDLQNADPNEDGPAAVDSAAIEEGGLGPGEGQQHQESPGQAAEEEPQQQQETPRPGKKRARPASSNQRLKREFRGRKSLAGVFWLSIVKYRASQFYHICLMLMAQRPHLL